MIEQILTDEYWFGACVKYGQDMPLSEASTLTLDFETNDTPNQAMPFMVSTKGRYLWREKGFSITFNRGKMEFPDDVLLAAGYQNLRGAYKAGMHQHFPFQAKGLSKALFENVIYNTWIELTFNQNQEDIISYASQILEEGMPPGILMIDDGWSENYGEWSFHTGKFPDPEGMIKQLEGMGFEVMLWICPYITPDTVAYREALREGVLIMNPTGDVYIAKWWNGHSAVVDMTNPKGREWLYKKLKALMDIGIKGFKFDGGDSIHYRVDNVTAFPTTPDEHSNLWTQFGRSFSYNEFRASYKAGGYGLLQRLCDKDHAWGRSGIHSLIPDSLLQGITGHPFSCPDMIGGGEYVNFHDAKASKLDEELFVRYCEIACLMPAMQFSAAPFRVLGPAYFQGILKSIAFRETYSHRILELVAEAQEHGEPIIRYMSYVFPDEGVERIIDQFMLGDDILVAPVYNKNVMGRDVYLPKGTWKHNSATIVSLGSSTYYESELGIPLVFERVKEK